jgi:hypothetical protein
VTDAATYTWVDPSGVSWPLSDPDTQRWWITRQPKGLGAIPISIATVARARGGVTIVNTQPQPRRISFGLYVEGDDHTGYVANSRTLGQALTCTSYLGTGQFQVSRPDGTVRQIDAVYEAGFDTEDEDLGVTSDLMAVTLLCPTPEWRDTQAVTVTSSYMASTGSFFSPYPNVSSGLTIGAATITNAGTATTWPSWTINGPASSITATNNTTGESWTVNPSATGLSYGDLTASDVVTVITDPPQITGPGAGNWQAGLAAGSTLWGLRPGANQITYSVTSAGTGTSVSLTYIPAYNTA